MGRSWVESAVPAPEPLISPDATSAPHLPLQVPTLHHPAPHLCLTLTEQIRTRLLPRSDTLLIYHPLTYIYILTPFRNMWPFTSRENKTSMDSRSLFSDIKNDLTAASLEFVGTIVFLLLGLGGIQSAATSASSLTAASSSSSAGGAQAVNTVASIDQLLYISVSMGLALLVSVWLFYRVTGGVFNPAVSTALFLIGAIGPVRWALYCIAQLLGAIVASAILLGLLPGPLVVTPAPGPNVNDAQAVFIEMFLTSFLVLAVLMLAAEKHRSTAFAPIGIGLTLFASHLFGVLYTGAAMNTARAFGPAVVSGFNRSHWVYWVGPFLGSILATTLYAFLKHVKYWQLNPDQDIDDVRASPADPIERAHTLGTGSSPTRRGNTSREKPNTMLAPPLNGSANV